MNVTSWQDRGQYIKIDGHSIFYIDHNPTAEKVICVLHGYPSASFDYYKILDQFKDYRLVIHDHLGFGLSDKPKDCAYLLSDQANIASKLWNKLGLEAIHLVAHDYGTSVATELVARDNANELSLSIKSLCLCNGSMLIDMAKLRFIQRLLKHPTSGKIVARFAMERTFLRNMKQIWFNKSLFDENEAKELWKLLLHNDGRRTLPRVTQYINQRYENYDRWIGALKGTSLSTLILWAENDPVAVIEMASVLKSYVKNSELHVLAETGHYPMLEKPAEWSAALLDFLNR